MRTKFFQYLVPTYWRTTKFTLRFLGGIPMLLQMQFLRWLRIFYGLLTYSTYKSFGHFQKILRNRHHDSGKFAELLTLCIGHCRNVVLWNPDLPVFFNNTVNRNFFYSIHLNIKLKLVCFLLVIYQVLGGPLSCFRVLESTFHCLHVWVHRVTFLYSSLQSEVAVILQN